MASRSINRVILMGNLTRDPELKYTPAGTAVCTFGVATNRSWTTSDGQIKEETQYHRIVAWQKLAELCGKLLSKGKKVYIEGRLTYRNYTAKDGTQKSVTEIVLDDFIVFNDGKKAAENAETKTEGETGDHGFSIPTEEAGDFAAPTEPKKASEDVNPDDIPF
ncbi:single-stranded DNA-binding protein [Candidatus Roizmanbacteria bacterium]|nr:single-stranded DNA-binding protein [Candidatus Roizmanbacteria bacterium]